MALVGIVVALAWQYKHPKPAQETFRGVPAVESGALTPEEWTDQLAASVELMRRAGWEPTPKDFSIPKGWKVPKGWQEPENWTPPAWWPDDR